MDLQLLHLVLAQQLGDIVSVAMDLDNATKTIKFQKNGVGLIVATQQMEQMTALVIKRDDPIGYLL
jgi:hypothetical protein